MSVYALPRLAVMPGVAAACAGLDSAREVALGGVEDADLSSGVGALAVLESQAASLRLALLAEADRRSIADQHAATGTDAWAAGLTGDTREATAGGIRLAHLLRTKYAATREAFAAGQLRLAQVKVIVNVSEQVPPEVTPEQLAIAEEILVGKATGEGTRSGQPMNAKRLRQVARRMLDVVDTDLANKHESILLHRERSAAQLETYLSLNDNGDGTFSGKFTIPELHGHLFLDALQRLSAPRRLSRDRDGKTIEDESAPSSGNIYEGHGHAFLELLEHLPTTGHAANGATLLITMQLEALLDGLGSARLDTGTRIGAGDARRLACEAGLVPIVLDGDSMPLDLGREARLHTKAQRRALATVHETCAIEGCERPFAWCEIHHPHPWSRGGTTDLANAVPFCGYHHQRAHDDRFNLRNHAEHGWRLHPRR